MHVTGHRLGEPEAAKFASPSSSFPEGPRDRLVRRPGRRHRRVITDNGPCYRSALWLDVCRRHGITPKPTRAYRPQTNGKVERFHRPLLVEWAYVRVYSSDRARTTALRRCLHLYNHHRTHTAAVLARMLRCLVHRSPRDVCQ